MTTFFNVDIETSTTLPASGHLLTIGVQPVRFDADPYVCELLPYRFYVRIDRTASLNMDAADGMYWGDPESPASSYGWWLEQNEEARREAFEDLTLVRHEPRLAAQMLREYICEVEPEQKQRIFVANPVSFDKPFIDQFFWENDVENPFSYQSLCLRSMKFGLRPGSGWGGSRDNHEPKIPHHAYWDAFAQAKDLISMLTEREMVFRLEAAVG